MNQNDPFSIFDVSGKSYTEATAEEQSGANNPDFYRPRLSKDVKEYSALLRFVPNINDVANSTVMKYGYFFDSDPANPERSIWVDCTSNEKGTKPNIITQAFFNLRKQENVMFKNMARMFSRKTYFWMLAYVMTDSIDPEVNGKVKIMRYGKQINQKAEAELKGDPSMGIKGTTFYNPMAGKDFIMKIGKKTSDKGEFTSYEESRFAPDLTSFGFTSHDANGAMSVERIKDAAEDKQKLADFLKKESPDLAQMLYVPWTDEIREKAELIVKNTISNDTLFDAIYKQTYGRSVPVASQPAATAAPSTVPVNETQDTIASITKPVAQPVAQPAAQPQPAAPVDEFEGMDMDTLDEIDLDAGM